MNVSFIWIWINFQNTLEMAKDLKIDNGPIGPIAIPQKGARKLILKADKRPSNKMPMFRVTTGETYNKEETDLD